MSLSSSRNSATMQPLAHSGVCSWQKGLVQALLLAALLIRLGLLLDANLIGLQNGLIQGLAAGRIFAKLRIGMPVADGTLRLGDKLSRNLIPQGGHHSLPAWR